MGGNKFDSHPSDRRGQLCIDGAADPVYAGTRVVEGEYGLGAQVKQFALERNPRQVHTIEENIVRKDGLCLQVELR